MIKEAILKVINGNDLNADEAYNTMDEIMSGEASEVQMSAYLTALSMKGETIEEITASAKAMRAHCVKLLNDEYIEGIFVSDEMQSCGIGKLLLDYIKNKKVSLRLNVYQKNARAISFYQREGFIVQCEGLDEATGEKEYTMLWKQK